jgi:ABC-2 type transport system permease protein
MHKILVIAKREYLAAVRTKAFIITLVLMPVLMGASFGVQFLFKKLDDTKEKRYAVIDRTPDQVVVPWLQKRAEQRNTIEIVDEDDPTHQTAPRFALEVVPPGTNAEEIDKQRLELSGRAERGELEGILEIGPEALNIRPANIRPTDVEEPAAIRFQSKNPVQSAFRFWAEREVNAAIQQFRFKAHGLEPEDVARIQQWVPVKGKSLTRLDPQTGEIKDAADETRIVNMLLPAVLIGLMFMVIMVGATPAMQGIVEEKGARIAEVLLGSVTPFEIMAGKLLGVIGIALTMAVVYLGGGYAIAANAGMAGILSPWLIFWFIVNLILALLIFGSVFIAVGAAATDVKDTQTLMMPIMIIACIPFFALSAIIQDPNGIIAQVCTFFPFATPMLLVARESVPPGVPIWEMIAGIVLVLVTTLLCVWAAGRIFRIGILMTGKPPSFRQMVAWAIKG